MITKPVEVTPSTACRYPKKRNLVNMRMNAFTGLILIIMIAALVLASTNLLPRTIPPAHHQIVNPQIVINITYGGAGIEAVSAETGGGSALVQTRDGGFALVGEVDSFGAGIRDMWLVKTDRNGIVQWNQTYGGTRCDRGSALIQTRDGDFALAGTTESFGAGLRDMWLVKTDANGIAQWNQTYGGTGDEWPPALVQTTDGGFALAGTTESFGGGMWLVKTDTNGIAQWNQTYGAAIQYAHALVQTMDGGFALAGYTSSFGHGMWLVKTDANGIVQWNQTYGGSSWDTAYSLVQTADGGFTLAGCTTSFGAGSSDMWLVKTDRNGVVQWNQTYGGSSWDQAFTLVQTTDEGFALAGFTDSFGAGSFDMWLVKTNANGVAQWNQTYGGTGCDRASSLIQTADGGIALAGFTDSFGAGSFDIWLVKTDANGLGLTTSTTTP